MNTIEITNVRVFDGTKLSELKTVVIENGIISSLTNGEIVLDAQGGTLLPGFIDSHIHLDNKSNLEDAAKWGITTMLDMATTSPELVDSLRNQPGLTDIRSCYHPASAAGGIQTSRLGFPVSSIVNGPEDAERFVVEQIKLGADYIKIVLEDPNVMGPAALTPETVTALVEASHKFNKQVFAHVTSINAFKIGTDAGVDVLTHVPLGEALPETIVKDIVKKALITVPTLVMIKGIGQSLTNMPTHPVIDYHNSELTVEAFVKAGIPIIVGTDACSDPNTFCKISHGKSIHEEFQLLMAAGMTPVQVLQGATSLPAKMFGFHDRGSIEVGKRADLVLVDGDPTVDIKATRKIKNVWIGGIEVNK